MAPRRPMTYSQALLRAEALCARSEQASAEIREKLRRWGVPAAEAERVIASLIERRFVDDRRFAIAYARDKYRFARWGRTKIHTGLYSKRIPPEVIAEALDEIDQREYTAIAFRMMRVKLQSLSAKEAADSGQEELDSDGREERRRELRMKLYRFGVGRGFESALVVKILNSPKLWG